MELKLLKTFVTVAETGTVARAADRLHCVQSNVTTRVKSLEAELGLTLFERRRSGMALTAAGAHFLPRAREVLRSVAQAEASVSEFGSRALFLRVGSMETTLAVRLPRYLQRFRAAHPDVEIRLSAGPTDDLVTGLLNGALDVALIGGAFAHPRIAGEPVFTEEMVLVTQKSVADPGAARELPVAVFRQGCSYREFTLRWMRQAGLAPNEVFELGTLEGILGCVAAGIGVSCLPYSVVQKSALRTDLAAHRLGATARIETHAVRLRDARPNGAADLFLETLRAGGG